MSSSHYCLASQHPMTFASLIATHLATTHTTHTSHTHIIFPDLDFMKKVRREEIE